jgi:Na+/proline symporter
VNLAVFAIARAQGAPLLVRFSAHRAAWSITAADVIVAMLVALGLGTAGTALWLRRHRRGLLLAQVIGALVALVSLSISLSVHADSDTKATLASMHLIAGTAFIAAMAVSRRSARRSQATSGADLTHRDGHGKAA